MGQLAVQTRGLEMSWVGRGQGVVCRASGQSGLGGGFQIMEEQSDQDHGVIKGGGKNGFAGVLYPDSRGAPAADMGC